ncbi:CgeB family protein [Desulfovibrio sp. TomC]|uniref:CgeB family protein n=1 Tax=Desulfovibrio sp. TomC TaxID=1562888 RepID=UPI00057402D4|nr:glycosyltransferase [Desulfovibrio sp. TomC]KHK00786.1 CgeB family protein [Desulfovibrio sp. TomC]
MPVPPCPDYAATALYAPDGSVADVRLTVAGKVRHLAGRGGAAAERDKALAVTAAAGPGSLPVFVGAGLGAGIAAVREAGFAPVFVLDRETAIDAATGVRARFANDPAVRFCSDPDPLAAAAQAADAARNAGFARLCPIAHPAYARLNPDWYAAATAGIARYEALRQKIGYRKFSAQPPRVLILRRPYFLYREIETALTRLGVAHLALDMGQGERGEATTVEALLAAVARFRPDFALTVNHLGLDRQGRLAGLLHDIGLPLASWFVDSPRLILHDYAGLATPGTMLFSYDADAAAEMRGLGYAHTAWLPLATDTGRFTRRAPIPGHPWQADVSFVGASMVSQAAEAMARLGHVPALAAVLPGAAAAFAASPEKSARDFLLAHPATAPGYAALAEGEDRLAAEQALTWEATRLVRHACVGQLLPFAPLIAGDAAWDTVFPKAPSGWRRITPLEYYEELPQFYPQSAVSLNTTSLQMKGAVNQRVFDVPACGGFVLTDAREQLEALFDAGRECAVYDHPEAIGDMVRHYLAHPAERARLTGAARQRILAEHTYDKRLGQLLDAMQKAFGR